MSMHPLILHRQSTISPVLLESCKIDNFLASRILKQGLRLTYYTKWQIKATDHHSCLIGGEPEDGGMRLVLCLIWTPAMIGNNACKFKPCSFTIRKAPFAT